MSAITPQLLLKAYSVGVFPMAESADDPALYWIEPEERGVLPLDSFHVSHSLRKAVRHGGFEIRLDTAFASVMQHCAEKTPDRKDTWINARIIKLYGQLHKMGFCHSVEAWRDETLVGGLYGLELGGVFFGESMFSRATDASKVALVHLVARLNFGGFKMLDAQFLNSHLEQFGCITMSKLAYRPLLDAAQDSNADFFAFKKDHDVEAVLKLAATG